MHVWPYTPKMIVSIWRNLWRLSASKKSTSSFTIFLVYCKDIVNLLFWVLRVYLLEKNQLHLSYFSGYIYFGYFEHAWLHTPKMIVSTCRGLRYLSACQKWTSSFTSFLRYYILKNPVIWLADSILAHNSRNTIKPDMALVVKYQQ